MTISVYSILFIAFLCWRAANFVQATNGQLRTSQLMPSLAQGAESSNLFLRGILLPPVNYAHKFLHANYKVEVALDDGISENNKGKLFEMSNAENVPTTTTITNKYGAFSVDLRSSIFSSVDNVKECNLVVRFFIATIGDQTWMSANAVYFAINNFDPTKSYFYKFIMGQENGISLNPIELLLLENERILHEEQRYPPMSFRYPPMSFQRPPPANPSSSAATEIVLNPSPLNYYVPWEGDFNRGNTKKAKRKMTKLTTEQIEYLEDLYDELLMQTNKKKSFTTIAEKLGTDVKVIRNWFYNRKERKRQAGIRIAVEGANSGHQMDNIQLADDSDEQTNETAAEDTEEGMQATIGESERQLEEGVQNDDDDGDDDGDADALRRKKGKAPAMK